MNDNRLAELNNKLTVLLNDFPEVDNFFLGIRAGENLLVITDDCPICFKEMIVNWIQDYKIQHTGTKSRVAQC